MKTLLTLLLAILSTCLWGQQYDKILSEIYEIEKTLSCVTIDSVSELYREKYNILRRDEKVFDRLNLNPNDTVYLFELFNAFTADRPALSIWNKRSNVYLQIDKGKTDVMKTEEKHKVFSKKLYNAVLDWENYTNSPKAIRYYNEPRVLTVRIIFNNGEYSIDHYINWLNDKEVENNEIIIDN